MMIFKQLIVSLLIASQVLQGSVMEEDKTYNMNTNPALLDIYLKALLEKESSGNYNAVHKPSTIEDSVTGKPIRVQALGGYGILDINWYGTDTQKSWTEMAGLKGASIDDPKAQDDVARFMVQKYFDKYGSWDLVSVAWFAGPGKAQTLKNNGTINFSEVDSKGTSIADYIAGINKNLSEELMNMEVDMQPIEISPPEPDTPVPIDTTSRSPGVTNQFGTPPNDNERYAAQILDAITRSNAGGVRPSFNNRSQPQAVEQVNQYAQTVEQAFQQYLDAVNNG